MAPAPSFTAVGNTIPNLYGGGVGQSYATADQAATAAKNQTAGLTDAANPNNANSKPANQSSEINPNGNSADVVSPTVVTSSGAKDNLANITKFLATVKTSMAGQANVNAATSAQPKVPNYNVTTEKTGTDGEIPITSNGQTYYATPNGPGITADAIKSLLTGSGTDTDTSGASNQGSSTGKSTPSSSGSAIDQTNQNIGSENASYAQGQQQILSDTEQAYNNYTDAVNQIRSGAFPLSTAQQAIIDATNNAFNGMMRQANLKAAAISSETGGFSNKVSSTAGELANIESQQSLAVAKLEQGFQDDNYKYIKDAYDEFNTLETKKTDALTSLHTAVMDQYKTALDEQQKTQDSIDTVAEDAAKNGADQNTIAAIRASGDVGAAIGAAGAYLQTGTGQVGDYLQYKRDTLSKGLTPQDYSTWKTADDAKQAKQKYSEAYATEAGKAAADTALGIGDVTTPVTEEGVAATGITQATGLSLQAFNYLTQGTASMSRMPAAQRNQIMKEANDYLTKTGTDISTFQSQYKAYNDVVQKNIERANNTKIFGAEVSGTVDQFVNDIGDNLGSLKAANVAKLFAGKEVNDPTVQKYNFDLKTMQNDLAGYYAASRGGTQPDDSDLQAAADVIVNGLNGKSATAFQDSINSNEQKVTKVVNTAVDSARKQVWDLFGVGGKYTPPSEQVNSKDAVDSYVKSNPAQADTVAKLYEVPGATDQDVYDYIQKLNQK